MLGIGPGAYIRTLQLNRVRRDLLSGDHRGVSIGDIAARYGVWHWSRISLQYRLLFGELPSQTRARHASGSSAPTPPEGPTAPGALAAGTAAWGESADHRLHCAPD